MDLAGRLRMTTSGRIRIYTGTFPLADTTLRYVGSAIRETIATRSCVMRSLAAALVLSISET